jgi:putative ABC transport system permease protein
MTPPRLAQWLLDRLLDADAAEAIRGDLDETFASRAPFGARAARRWYWRQTIVSLASRARSRAERRHPSRPGVRIMIESLLTELRQISRGLRRSPGFIAAVTIPLALALALATSVASVVDAVLARDLPFEHPERVVIVGETEEGAFPGNIGFETFAALRQQTRTLRTLAAARSWLPTLTVPAVERLAGLRVSASFFSTLGIAPAMGRDFQPGDDTPDARFVVIISHGLWQRLFGGDPHVLQRALRLGDRDFRIVGVMPRDFEPMVSTEFYTPAEIWAPLGYVVGGDSSCRSCRHLRAIGALAEGVSLDTSREELTALHHGMAAAFPADYGRNALKVERFSDRIVRPFTTPLLVLTGAVVLVLLIAAANASSLTLTRAADLEHEMALRAALGASRTRLIRHRLLEALVVSGAAGLAGVAGGAMLTRWMVANAPEKLPHADHIGLSLPVVLIMVGAAVGVALLVGLAPALARSKTTVVSRTRATGSRSLIRIREALVVVDVALALTLGVGAGVMIRSVERLLAVDPGFVPADVYTTQMSLVGARWATDDPVREFQRALLERVQALPGVTAAAVAGQVPLGGDYDRRGGYLEERQTGRAEDGVEFERYSVSPEYFRVMGLPIVRGRGIEPRDGQASPRIMLVNETAARRYWPNQDPIGRKVVFDPKAPAVSVVGVVGDVRHYRLEDPPAPQMYMPQEQMTDSFLVLVVKSPAFDTRWPAVRQIVKELASDVPMYSFASMDELVSKSAAPRRFTAFLLGVFAISAIAMTAAGVYGLVAYSVARRAREFGIRMALGASRGAIRRLVLVRGLLLTSLGVTAGLVGSAFAGRALGGIKYQTSGLDGAVVLATVAILALAAMLAHAAPLSRAVGVSPTDALRSE